MLPLSMWLDWAGIGIDPPRAETLTDWSGQP